MRVTQHLKAIEHLRQQLGKEKKDKTLFIIIDNWTAIPVAVDHLLDDQIPKVEEPRRHVTFSSTLRNSETRRSGGESN